MATFKRSTNNILDSLWNQPHTQQLMGRSTNIGQDKRAVGANREIIGGLVKNQRDHLLNLDVEGYKLKSRKDKLNFARQIAAKEQALYQKKRKINQRSDKLATILGGISTAASGFNTINEWRRNRAANKRSQQLMDYRILDFYENRKIKNPNIRRRYASSFNRIYGGNRK